MQARNSIGGRSLGPPRRPSVNSENTAPDGRFSSTRKRSSSRTRSSLRTPNAATSALKPVQNSSNRLSSSVTRSRVPPVGLDVPRAAKDSRPLRDKSWQVEQVKALLDFLREHNYPNRELSSKNFPLSANEFKGIFSFLMVFLSPDYRLPPKFESELPALLKALEYPGVISKSIFVTIGSPHSWPSILGVLLFLKDSAAYLHQRKAQSFFFKEGAEDVESKLKFEFYMDTYNKFMAGQSSFEEEIRDLPEQILHHLDLGPKKLLRLKEERDELKATLEGLSSESGKLERLKNKKKFLAEDIQRMTDYRLKCKEYAQTKAAELQAAQQRKAELVDEVKDLEAGLSGSLNQMGPLENRPAQIESLEVIMDGLSEDLRRVDEEICALEIRQSKLKARCDSAVQEFNVIVEELECPGLEKVGEIEDFDENYQFRLIDASSAANRELRSAQDEAEELQSQLERLKSDIHSRREESTHLSKALELQKMEILGLERRFKEEEAAIDAEILGLKAKVVKLQSENQPPLVSALSKKMNTLEELRNAKREKLEKRIQDVNIFLEKVTQLSIAYIEKVKEIKGSQLDERLQAAKSSLDKGEKLRKKLEKHIQYLKDKEKSS